MTRNLTCIICPRGCELTVDGDNGNLKVSGNSCKKGEQYAIAECTNPTRTVTSVIKVTNRENTTVSVKTDKPIAKSDIFNLMKLIRNAEATAPIKIGDIIIKNACGSNIIATKNID